jgi:hypothetical protein
LVAATASLGAWSLGYAQAASVTELLPNLVADPPVRTYLSSEMGRLLLRFDGYVHNIGPGPLEVTGQRGSIADPMIPHQRIYRSDGSSYDVVMPGALMVYASADGHEHWHLQNVAAYSLWNRRRTREVAPAMKIGFCLADHEHVDGRVGPAGPVYTDVHGRDFCQKYNPNALSVWEGVSAGWRDLYERSLTFQWVDVSDVVPGVYWLREDVDPNRIVREANPVKAPAYKTSPTIIPGYIAKPLALGSLAPSSPVAITLDDHRYGPTGAVLFRIVKPPTHGNLNVRVGSVLSHERIIYRPRRGYRGPDQFTYIARDSASRYPYNPVEATVSLNIGPPVVSSPRISPSTFRLGPVLPRLSPDPRVGPTISFALSEAARTTLAFSRCVATSPSSTDRTRHCTRKVKAGSLTFNAVAGFNYVRFHGRLSRRHSLMPGNYILTVTAFDRARARSNAPTLSFTLRR